MLKENCQNFDWTKNNQDNLMLIATVTFFDESLFYLLVSVTSSFPVPLTFNTFHGLERSSKAFGNIFFKKNISFHDNKRYELDQYKYHA